MSKTYTPEEVAKAVLKKCQELVEEQKLKKAEIDKCGDINKEKSPVAKSSHLKNFMEKKKKKADLKKIGGLGHAGTATPGSVPATGGSSIASQIGFGKKEKKVKKVKKADPMAANKAAGLKPLTSDKIKPPSADQMPEKPKAATTLKSYMAKRKK